MRRVDARIVAVALLVISVVPLTLANDDSICQYMIAIPREDRPEDFPDQDFEGTTWQERPFVTAERREDVCLDNYFPASTSSGTQMIWMEEEIEGDVAIAKINYHGTETPTIALPFLAGAAANLGAVIRQVDDDWYLIITQRQDYETPAMQLYSFNIRIDGETLVANVRLQIVNIDDNDPIIYAVEPCQVPEAGEPGLSECVYQVQDIDGEISTRQMTFRIDSERDDGDIFYIVGTNIPGNWYWMHMTVGIRTPLNFETNALHIFTVTALDSRYNDHTVTIMVQVQNVESRPPRWIEIFAVQQFDEKTYQSFPVRAIDGDTGINKPIYYRIYTDEEDDFFIIENFEDGYSGAILHVTPINRDILERDIFRLSIEAYKITDNNEELSTITNIVIVINDINDQRPVPLFPEYHVEFAEETPLTLEFDRDFGFHDRDLGQHAQYTVHLESVRPEGAALAFYIAPQVGYQRQTFVMGTLNHNMLDYEVPEFQSIEIEVVAIDTNRTEFIERAKVYISLINWNDEEPIFEYSSQEVSFNETEGKDFYVARVLAHDRDIDDRVIHSLLGNVGDFLTIDPDTGDITVAIDDAFDYHRQSELHIQVRAVDTLGEPYHIATAQLVIRLIDINNTPPSLRLPRGNPEVEENVPDGFVITEGITATDPDTTAFLVFEIDWESSYATKQGRGTPTQEFHGCVDIETIYPDSTDTGSVVGLLKAKEIRPGVTIDFEEFEVLYLTVRVRDIRTELGEDFDEMTLAIIIIDMNDNWPIWASETLNQQFRVRENSQSNVVIGSVLATDIDGPLYNQVRYTIRPREDTPEGLVKIDFYTGQIDVDTEYAIDADTPPRENLYYTVIASDQCYYENKEDCPEDETYWETEGDITIYIIDTNNKQPVPNPMQIDLEVEIYEDAVTGDEVVTLLSTDLDRDVIYHTVRYQINYPVNPRIRDFFSVDLDTGLVYVYYTTEETLDRDNGEATHRIFLNLIDNFYSEGDGQRNQIDLMITVVLLDVNDNAPELPPPEQLSWTVSESLTEGTRLERYIYAPDRDEPETNNSRVAYRLLDFSIQDRDIEHPDLFSVENVEITYWNVTAELETTMDLKGYWGTYEIHILAHDHGDPQMCSDEKYQLIIRPYNFHVPEFVFPTDGTRLRLAKERAQVNSMLILVNGEFLDRILATDEDGLHAGEVDFTIDGDADALDYFDVANDGENQATLMLTQMFSEDIREFTVTIRATDRGTEPGPLSSTSTLTLTFVPTLGDPIFAVNTASVAFVEREGGLTESHQLPAAEDPKNHGCQDDCHAIYYRIIDGNDEGHFDVDPERNILYVVRELDRSESETHELTIAASNSLTPGAPLAGATLTVTITVRDANPRPIFARSLYTAGISTQDSVNRELLTLRATHSENVLITYSIDESSMQVDSSLEQVRDLAFILDSVTGVLSLNIQPSASMHGMFEFDVIATDPNGAYDTAQVKIYLISSLNRVFFIFVNTLDETEPHSYFIAQTFSTGFGMTCNIDQILPATDSNSVARDDVTEVRAHFIQDDIPVSTDVIEELRRDTQLLLSIQVALRSNNLLLQDFVIGDPTIQVSDQNQITVYILAALSAILAFMVVVLLLTFIIRTRALHRQLSALSMTKYGSMESNLNRAGLAAPGTNKHTVEGSNPIYNEALRSPDFDAISDTSGDSELIGVEDMPQFRYDYMSPEDASSTQEIIPTNVGGTINSKTRLEQAEETEKKENQDTNEIKTHNGPTNSEEGNKIEYDVDNEPNTITGQKVNDFADTKCMFCQRLFSEDTEGETWVECRMCGLWAHNDCAEPKFVAWTADFFK